MIKICTMRFNAELAVNGKLSSKDIEELHKAIERTIKQYGFCGDFMLGMSTIEITENKNASKR